MRSMHANAVRPFSVRNRDVIMNVQSLHVVVPLKSVVSGSSSLLSPLVGWNGVFEYVVVEEADMLPDHF